jgi:hypothetical protein
LLFHIHFKFVNYLIFIVITFNFLLHCPTALSPRLRATSQRLGAVAASTNVYAGYKVSIMHGIFRGVTAAIAPNRKLHASGATVRWDNEVEN